MPPRDALQVFTKGVAPVASRTEFNAAEMAAIQGQRVWPRLLSIPLALLAIVAIGDPPFGNTTPGVVLLSGLAGYGLFCWTSVFHETAHQTLFGSGRFNVWLGRILGTVMFVPYTAYRQVHIRHHAYLNRPDDWELWPYADPKCSKGFRRCYAWFDLFLGVPSGAIIYGRIFFHKPSPLTDHATRSAIRLEYALIVLFWSSLIAVNTWLGRLDQHLLAIGGPLFVAGFLQTGRKFTEHLGMASFDPLEGTRTVLPQKILLRICSFFHFDIFVHGPHHRHPRATHGTLQQCMQDYLQHEPEVRYPVFRTYGRAVIDMLPCLLKNPACGVNAGQPLGASSLEQVEDFIPDSTEATRSSKATDESTLARSA